MQAEPLETLLERLNTGDDAAAERAFLEYEPYLRKVVRRLLPAALRPKFDSVDVVQSVYGDVLAAFREGGMRFGTPAQLRAFLMKATRNRFIDRARQYHAAARLERPLGDVEGAAGAGPAQRLPPARQPRPSETAAADELWERLLSAAPPQHHALLRLRRRGASAAEIAAQTGMHEGSVRRALRNLAVRLAFDDAPAPATAAKPGAER